MANKILKVSIAVVGVVLILSMTVFYLRESTTIVRWKGQGIIQSELYTRPDSTYEFTRVDTSDFVSRPFPSAGDRIYRIEDSIATRQLWQKYFDSPQPVGKEIPIEFTTQSDTLKTVVRLGRIHSGFFLAFATMAILRFLISAFYLAVGLWAFIKRPNSGAVRALSLFCFSMSAFMVTGIRMGLDNYAAFSIPHLDLMLEIFGTFAIFFGSFWLNLQLLFPSPRKFMKNHSLLGHLVCYLPTIILLTSNQILGWRIMGIITISYITIQIAAGFAFLTNSHRSLKDPLEKRQTRLVLWGSGAGLGTLGILLILAIIASSWLPRVSQMLMMSILTVAFLAILLSPLSFAYAFGRYRLLEIEGRIKRGTRYIIVSLALLVVFYGLVYLFSEFLLDTMGITSRVPTVVIALLLAIGFTPTQKWIQAFLEKRIYPERIRLRELLRDFLESSLTATDKTIFWSGLENRLKQILGVETIYPVLRSAGEGDFINWNGTHTPFASGGEFIGEIAKIGNRPILRDELEASQKVSLTDSERGWLYGNKIALILSMVARLKIIGFLGIGLKTQKEDFEVADFEILQSLASQVAVAGENIMLLEENVEKRRLESELSLARKVQEGMLPRDIPNTPGLIVAARSRFCTEVAGDYYDIIPLDGDRTALAIGDVSGQRRGSRASHVKRSGIIPNRYWN